MARIDALPDATTRQSRPQQDMYIAPCGNPLPRSTPIKAVELARNKMHTTSYNVENKRDYEYSMFALRSIVRRSVQAGVPIP